MSSTFTIKRGDTSPQTIYTLSPSVNLVGAASVFNMSDHVGDKIVDRASASIEDSSVGILGFTFTALKTTEASTYFGEFEITYSYSTIETYPNNGYLTIKVTPDLE